MNRLIIWVCLFLATPFISAQTINFYPGSLDNAIAIAELRDRPIFVDVSTTWCQPCHQLETGIYRDKNLVDYINTHFVSLRWDAESKMAKKFEQEFGLKGYPTLIFLDKSGQLIQIHEGTPKKAEMLDMLTSCRKFQQSEQIAALLRLYRNNLYDKQALEQLAQLVQDYDFFDKEKLVQIYYYILTPAQRIENLEFFLSNIKYLDHQMLKTVIENYEGPSGFFITAQDRLRHEAILREIENKLADFIDQTRDLKDLGKIQTLSEMNNNFVEKNFQFDIDRKLKARKKNEFLLLDYYDANDMRKEYLALAERIIDRYVFHLKPSDTKLDDEQAGIHPAASFPINFVTSFEEQNRLLEIVPDSLSQLRKRYPKSVEASLHLNRISLDILRLYNLPDESSEVNANADQSEDTTPADYNEDQYRRILSRGAYWASMSYRYFPMAKYYLTHAKLALELGDEELAGQILKDGISLGTPDAALLEEMNLMLSKISPEDPEE